MLDSIVTRAYSEHGSNCFLVSVICRMDSCPLPKVCIVRNLKPECVCKCEGPYCDFKDKVCGSDGESYPTGRDFGLLTCSMGKKDVTVSYFHECKREASFFPNLDYIEWPL